MNRLIILSSLLVLAMPAATGDADGPFFEAYYRYHAEQDLVRAKSLLQGYVDQKEGRYLGKAEYLLAQIRGSTGTDAAFGDSGEVATFQVDERWETWAKDRKQLEQTAREKQATDFWESTCLMSKALYGRTVETYQKKRQKLENSALAYEKEAQKLERVGDDAAAGQHRQRAEGYRNELTYMPPIRDRIGWAGQGWGSFLFLAHDITGLPSASGEESEPNDQLDQVRKVVHQAVLNYIEYLEQNEPAGCSHLLEQLTRIESALHGGRYQEAQGLMDKTLAAALE